MRWPMSWAGAWARGGASQPPEDWPPPSSHPSRPPSPTTSAGARHTDPGRDPRSEHRPRPRTRPTRPMATATRTTHPRHLLEQAGHGRPVTLLSSTRRCLRPLRIRGLRGRHRARPTPGRTRRKLHNGRMGLGTWRCRPDPGPHLVGTSRQAHHGHHPHSAPHRCGRCDHPRPGPGSRTHSPPRGSGRRRRQGPRQPHAPPSHRRHRSLGRHPLRLSPAYWLHLRPSPQPSRPGRVRASPRSWAATRTCPPCSPSRPLRLRAWLPPPPQAPCVCP